MAVLTPVNLALIAMAVIALVVLMRVRKKRAPTAAKAPGSRRLRGRRRKGAPEAATTATAFAALVDQASPDDGTDHLEAPTEIVTTMSAVQPLAVPWTPPEPISAPGWPGCDDGEWAGLFDADVEEDTLRLADPAFAGDAPTSRVALAEVAASTASDAPAPADVTMQTWDVGDGGFDLATGFGVADETWDDDVAATLVEDPSPSGTTALPAWTFDVDETRDATGGLTIEP